MREILQINRQAQGRIARLNKSVLKSHTQAKEEQKKIERITEECSRALEVNDEKAYMRSVDATKDTRITQLLRQTDNYLESLALSGLSKITDEIATTLIRGKVLPVRLPLVRQSHLTMERRARLITVPLLTGFETSPNSFLCLFSDMGPLVCLNRICWILF